MTNENKYDYHARISKFILATREEEFEILDKEHKPYPYINIDEGSPDFCSPDYKADPDYYAGEKWIPIEQISFHRETPQETIALINTHTSTQSITASPDSMTQPSSLPGQHSSLPGQQYKLKSNK